LERILEALAAIVDGLETRENSVEKVLDVGVEGWSDGDGILGFSGASGFVAILKIGVIGGSPLVLPAHVIGVAGGPVDLAIF
jgi:hypothetical protein